MTKDNKNKKDGHTKQEAPKPKFADKFPSKAPKKDVAPEVTQADLDEARAQTVRIAADFENFRKRTEKDIQEAKNYSVNAFARDMIEILENLYRAEESIDIEKVKNDDTLKQIYTGVELIKKIYDRYV